jgi:hypothetical protein
MTHNSNSQYNFLNNLPSNQSNIQDSLQLSQTHAILQNLSHLVKSFNTTNKSIAGSIDSSNPIILQQNNTIHL